MDAVMVVVLVVEEIAAGEVSAVCFNCLIPKVVPKALCAGGRFEGVRGPEWRE